jgi:nucleoside-diphosphate-sugar epimerase
MPGQSTSVLITGANGFIGSRLCRLFLDRGWRVIAGVRENANCSLLSGLDVEYRYGDICHPESLRELVASVDCIIHNAGLVKAKSRKRFFEVNQKGTENLLQAIVDHGGTPRRVVIISSLAAAGPIRDNRPLRESDPPQPISVYGESKLACERTALTFADRLSLVIVRPPGVYGPGDREILTFFRAVYRKFIPLLGDSHRSIQLVHVDDLCRGVYAASTADSASGEVYFIAENRSYTMGELLGLLEKGCDRNGMRLTIPAGLFKLIAVISETLFRLIGATPMLTREKARELLAGWAIDPSKAREELGFESKIPFEQGARETYAWYIQEGWL